MVYIYGGVYFVVLANIDTAERFRPGLASEASQASEASYSKRSEPEATELHIRHAKNYT